MGDEKSKTKDWKNVKQPAERRKTEKGTTPRNRTFNIIVYSIRIQSAPHVLFREQNKR